MLPEVMREQHEGQVGKSPSPERSGWQEMHGGRHVNVDSDIKQRLLIGGWVTEPWSHLYWKRPLSSSCPIVHPALTGHQ